MRPNRCDHGHRIHLGRGDRLGSILGDLDIWVSLFGATQRVWPPIGDYREFTIVHIAKVTGYGRTPVAVTDDTDPNHNSLFIIGTMALGSISAVRIQQCQRRSEEDFDIHPERPRLGVLQVHANHFVKGNLAPSLDLP